MRRDKSPDEVLDAVERARRKQQVAQVLTRGHLNSKMQAVIDSLPPDKRGVFVREREDDIIRYRNLGYEIEMDLDVPGLHGTGDGRVRIGDVILMTTTRENHELIQEVKTERAFDKRMTERNRYMEMAQSEAAAPPFDESKEY